MIDLPGPTSHSFVSQRLRLNYVDWGNRDAPPLILQHGGLDHCRSWDWVAQRLRGDWHVVCPDLRGHGDSVWSPDADYSQRAFIYDFAQFVETLGYEQVSIVGHSLGGFITTAYTGIYPERVRRLVNIEGLGQPPAVTQRLAGMSPAEQWRDWITKRRQSAARQPRRYKTIEEAYARMRGENGFLSEAQARHLTHHAISRNEDGTWSWKFDNYLHSATMADFSREDQEDLIRAIACPVLLLYGKDSWATNPATDGRVDLFREPTVIGYEHAGHWLHHDQTERFLADLAEFL